MAETVPQLLLPLAALVLLAFWPFPFRTSDPRWRFEFFAVDFAWGALLVAAATTVLFSSVGEDAGFSERMLLSSRTAQALVVFGGFVFGLGLLALLGAARMLGLTLSLVLSLSLAAPVPAYLGLPASNIWKSAAGVLLAVAAVVTGWRAARGIDAPVTVRHDPRRPPPRAAVRRSTKGLLLAIFAGIFFAIAAPLALFGITSDFGVGAYSGLMLFTAGIPLAVLPFTLFLLNIKIEQPLGNLRQYWSRTALPARKGQHRLGLLGGMLWSAGTLAYLTVRASPDKTTNTHATLFALAGVVVAAFFAFLRPGDQAPTRSRSALAIALILFAGTMLLLAA